MAAVRRLRGRGRLVAAFEANEGRARYSHVEDTPHPPDYSGGSCHRYEDHREIGALGRVGWFFAPTTGWGMSLDFGTTAAPGDDSSLVSVGLNVEWIGTR